MCQGFLDSIRGHYKGGDPPPTRVTYMMLAIFYLENFYLEILILHLESKMSLHTFALASKIVEDPDEGYLRWRELHGTLPSKAYEAGAANLDDAVQELSEVLQAEPVSFTTYAEGCLLRIIERYLS